MPDITSFVEHDADRMQTECALQFLRLPDSAGVFRSLKWGRDFPVRGWRDRALLRFLEAWAAALLFREQVGVVTVFLDGTEIPCLVDGLLTTAAGCRLVLLDVPGLPGHEMETLKGLVSSRVGIPVLRVTDADLTAFLETERPPLAA